MVIKKIKLTTLVCYRCGYEWIPKRPFLPVHCARCNTPYWNKPRKNNSKKKG